MSCFECRSCCCCPLDNQWPGVSTGVVLERLNTNGRVLRTTVGGECVAANSGVAVAGVGAPGRVITDGDVVAPDGVS